MNEAPAARRSILSRVLTVIERGGNALPHPATLFVAMAALVIVVVWTLLLVIWVTVGLRVGPGAGLRLP